AGRRSFDADRVGGAAAGGAAGVLRPGRAGRDRGGAAAGGVLAWGPLRAHVRDPVRRRPVRAGAADPTAPDRLDPAEGGHAAGVGRGPGGAAVRATRLAGVRELPGRRGARAAALLRGHGGGPGEASRAVRHAVGAGVAGPGAADVLVPDVHAGPSRGARGGRGPGRDAAGRGRREPRGGHRADPVEGPADRVRTAVVVRGADGGGGGGGDADQRPVRDRVVQRAGRAGADGLRRLGVGGPGAGRAGPGGTGRDAGAAAAPDARRRAPGRTRAGGGAPGVRGDPRRRARGRAVHVGRREGPLARGFLLRPVRQPHGPAARRAGDGARALSP